MSFEKITPHTFDPTKNAPGFYIVLSALTNKPYGPKAHPCTTVAVGPFQDKQEAVWHTNTTSPGFVTMLAASPEGFKVSGVSHTYHIVQVANKDSDPLEEGVFLQ